MITFRQKKPSANDKFPDMVTLVSKKTGESITLDKRNPGFFWKFLNRINWLIFRVGYKNRISFNIMSGKKVIGYLELDHWSDEELHIEWVYIVKKESRGNGYARVILETVIKWASEMGYKKISLEAPYGLTMEIYDTSPWVQKFYKTLGFRKVRDDGEGLVLMEKKL